MSMISESEDGILSKAESTSLVIFFVKMTNIEQKHGREVCLQAHDAV